jgi:hypothetical protein
MGSNDLRQIFDELVDNRLLSATLDYESFVSSIDQYSYITELRKDLISRDYDVVDVVSFFENIVDEIPRLGKNDLRVWKTFVQENITFFLVNEFQSTYNGYKQSLYYFNDQDDVELVAEIDYPEKFYSKDPSYLDKLESNFNNSFIDFIYNYVTEPLIFKTFKSYTGKLCVSGKHREAKVFLEKRSKFLKAVNFTKLCEHIEDSFNDSSLHKGTKSNVLQALQNDDFDGAREILKAEFNSLSESSFEDIETLIEKHEREFERTLNQKRANELRDANSENARIEREEQAHREHLAEQNRIRSEQLRAEQNNSKAKSNPQIKVYHYNCFCCKTTVIQSHQPPIRGCPSTAYNNYHQWNKLAEVGNVNYQCTNCGLVINTNGVSPNTSSCSRSKYHYWSRM